jgi:PIN domain nuclease of toxin-antitoxin system
MMLLLDTHAFIWLASDQTQLSFDVKTAIRDSSTDLFVSSISALEISLLQKRNKLLLPLPPKDYYRKALQQHGIEEICPNSDILIKSALLPDIHNDPFDRTIIATAHLYKMTIITKDRTIPKYPKVAVVW